MINNIVLTSIWTRSKARVSRPIHTRLRILMKHTAISMFPPTLILQRIIPHQLQHSQTIERGVHPRGRINHEILTRFRIHELFRPLVSCQPDWPAVWDLFPWLIGNRYHPSVTKVRAYRPRILHFRDTQVSRPATVGVLPATVDVVEIVVVFEVGAVDCKLVKGIQHAFHGEGASPWVGTVTFEHKHAMIYGRAGERAHGVLQRWW